MREPDFRLPQAAGQVQWHAFAKPRRCDPRKRHYAPRPGCARARWGATRAAWTDRSRDFAFLSGEARITGRHSGDRGKCHEARFHGPD